MNIASGSSGNATYVGSDSTHILIDSGVSRKRIIEGLNKLGLSLDDITAVLVSHEHTDHVSSLRTLERTRQIPVFTTKGTADVLAAGSCLDGNTDILNIVSSDVPFSVGDIKITAIRTNHDAREPVCFRLSHNGKHCAVVTDLGVYDQDLVSKMQGLSAILIEANHDRRMLEAGPYPYPLKLRIAGDKGHLSNESSGKLLSLLLNDDLQHIALGHISQKNNSKELAWLTVVTEISENTQYHVSDLKIDIADQLMGTEIYDF